MIDLEYQINLLAVKYIDPYQNSLINNDKTRYREEQVPTLPFFTFISLKLKGTKRNSRELKGTQESSKELKGTQGNSSELI